MKQAEVMTYLDRRFYEVDGEFYPSVTTILKVIDKPALDRWKVGLGEEASEAVAEETSESGTRIHGICEALAKGESVNLAGLSYQEAQKVQGFVRWQEDTGAKILASEVVVCNKEIGYAGKVDLVVAIAGQKMVVDIKTGSRLYREYDYQGAAYVNAYGEGECRAMGLLRLRAPRTEREKSYQWKAFAVGETAEAFDCFLAAVKIWKDQYGSMKPRIWQIPLDLSLPKEYCCEPS